MQAYQKKTVCKHDASKLTDVKDTATKLNTTGLRAFEGLSNCVIPSDPVTSKVVNPIANF